MSWGDLDSGGWLLLLTLSLGFLGYFPKMPVSAGFADLWGGAAVVIFVTGALFGWSDGYLEAWAENAWVAGGFWLGYLLSIAFASYLVAIGLRLLGKLHRLIDPRDD